VRRGVCRGVAAAAGTAVARHAQLREADEQLAVVNVAAAVLVCKEEGGGLDEPANGCVWEPRAGESRWSNVRTCVAVAGVHMGLLTGE
jgi:hypothetical protein